MRYWLLPAAALLAASGTAKAQVVITSGTPYYYGGYTPYYYGGYTPYYYGSNYYGTPYYGGTTYNFAPIGQGGLIQAGVTAVLNEVLNDNDRGNYYGGNWVYPRYGYSNYYGGWPSYGYSNRYYSGGRNYYYGNRGRGWMRRR